MPSNKKFTVSLIIATYNWPEALNMVLLSVKKQSILPDAVFIADDGSTTDTQNLILEVQKTFPVPLKHIWHEDKGFRKTKILNETICKCSTDYIIQIDGDIIIHNNFIKDHIQNAATGFFIEGSRVWLNDELTKKAQRNQKTTFSIFSKGIKNRLNGVYLPFLTPFFSKPGNSIAYAVKTRGCNMSFWKKDMVAVNGYNEDLTGWGREDSELCVRLVNRGVTKKRIKFAAIQYHQHHTINSRKGLNKNDEILEKVIQEKSTACTNGINNHC